MGLFAVFFLSIVSSQIATNLAINNCGIRDLGASTTSSNSLRSPGNNGQETYPPDASCEWRITAPIGTLVVVTFSTFDTYGKPTCGASTDDVLKIYDSLSKYDLIGKYCGSYLPAKVTSSGRYLTLVFKSSSRYNVGKKGFRLQYKAIDNPADDESVCSPFNSNLNNKYINLKASTSTKLFKSPLYPDKYPSDIECIWYLKADWDKKIKLKLKSVNIFNYETPGYCNGYSSDVDYLIVYDGSFTSSTILKSYCSSSSLSTTVTSSSNYLTIRFKSNQDNYFTGSKAGFEAEYTEIEEESSSVVGVVIGSIIGVICVVGLVVCCVCIAKRRGYSGYVQRGPAVTTIQAATTTTTNAPHYPMQPQGGYQVPPPGGQVHYPPPGQGSHPTPVQGSYPPPIQGSYPPATQGSYPPSTQGSYPPPTQGSYPPPTQGSYPPTSQSSGYPPAAPYPVRSDPPPQYPGPPAYPPQANPPYNAQGGPQQPPYPPPVDSKASAPPQF